MARKAPDPKGNPKRVPKGSGAFAAVAEALLPDMNDPLALLQFMTPGLTVNRGLMATMRAVRTGPYAKAVEGLLPKFQQAKLEWLANRMPRANFVEQLAQPLRGGVAGQAARRTDAVFKALAEGKISGSRALRDALKAAAEFRSGTN
jgi:hypothetical protein